MTTSRQCKIEEIEGWFLAALEADELPVEEMLTAVAQVGGQRPAAGDGLCELLMERLLEVKAEFAAVLRLMSVWASWKKGDGAFAVTCRQALENATKDRLLLAFIKNSGFDARLDVGECLRRLSVLTGLKPGSYCYDKTWGFGVVQRVDEFYKKVTIDFTRKPGLPMTFAYAGETLGPVAADHFLVRTHEDREGMVAMCEANPDEVVRMMLRSFGPLTVTEVQERIEESLLGAGQWKRFWDAARKELKKDPLVDIPARRTDSIVLREAARSYGEGWFDRLAMETSREKICELLEEFVQAGQTADEKSVAIAAWRIEFAIKGAERSHLRLVTRLMLVGQRMGVKLSPETQSSIEAAFLHPEGFVGVMNTVSARERPELLRMLAGWQGEQLQAVGVEALPILLPAAVQDVVAYLTETGNEPVSRVREVFERRQAGPGLVYWLAQDVDRFEAWEIGAVESLVGQCVEAIEVKVSGDLLKVQKQLRQLFLSNTWVKRTFGSVAAPRKPVLLKRIDRSDGWELSEKRSVMARIIKLFPELASVLTGPSEEENGAGKQPRLTSWRSLRERQMQFKKLVEEDIPANSREIGIARSYGDLRENFEYQSAKDKQRLLLQRQKDMEADLAVVRGTDFADAPTDVVAMGVEVAIERPVGGNSVVYRIMGEWDLNEDLGIISCGSLVASKMLGCRVGDQFSLPAPTGEERCRLTAIRPLPEDVRQWAR